MVKRVEVAVHEESAGGKVLGVIQTVRADLPRCPKPLAEQIHPPATTTQRDKDENSMNQLKKQMDKKKMQ